MKILKITLNCKINYHEIKKKSEENEKNERFVIAYHHEKSNMHGSKLVSRVN